MIRDRERLLAQLRELHFDIQRSVVAAAETSSVEQMSRVMAEDRGGDTVFAIDRVSEARLTDYFERVIAPERSLVLVAEGLADSGAGPGVAVLPRGSSVDDAEIRVLMDPIDGTRGYMYQKRSAWILTCVAPNRGPGTSLADAELAVQTEIPLVKQHLADSLWAIRGEGLSAERFNRLSGERTALMLRPSQATTIAQGFATLSRFFPGSGSDIAEIEAQVVREAVGPVQSGRAQCYEDQYICSGGQLYELIAGHDRFVADLRPLFEPLRRARGLATGLCCHPYDLATALLAEEAGVIVTDARGHALDAPFATDADVAWVGYANTAIRAQIEPGLTRALGERGLL